jgi:hypothetical protein
VEPAQQVLFVVELVLLVRVCGDTSSPVISSLVATAVAEHQSNSQATFSRWSGGELVLRQVLHPECGSSTLSEPCSAIGFLIWNRNGRHLYLA